MLRSFFMGKDTKNLVKLSSCHLVIFISESRSLGSIE